MLPFISFEVIIQYDPTVRRHMRVNKISHEFWSIRRRYVTLDHCLRITVSFLFSCVVYLFSILCILCFCTVLCGVPLFTHSCLFPVFVQVYQPLLSGVNPSAVNKYHIASYQNLHFPIFHLRVVTDPILQISNSFRNTKCLKTSTSTRRITQRIRSEHLVVIQQYEMRWNANPPAGRGGFKKVVLLLSQQRAWWWPKLCAHNSKI